MKLPLNKLTICSIIVILLLGVGIVYNASYIDINTKESIEEVYCERTGLEYELDKRSEEEIIETFNGNIDHSVEILSATKEHIILWNNSNILTLGNDGRKFKVKKLIDLNILVGEKTNCNREIAISPNNKAVVFANCNEETKEKKVYYHDLDRDELVTIDTDKIMDVIDNWSTNSMYYVYGFKDGVNINLFDVESQTTSKIVFDKENIKEIYVTDSGDIYVNTNTNTKYYIHKNNDFSISEISINGILIGCNEEKIMYYYGGDIFSYEKGKIEKIVEVGKEFELVNNDSNRAVFSNQTETIVYDYKENELNKYAFKYEQINYILFNNTSDKCLIDSDRFNAKVIGCNGQYFRIENSIMLDYIGKCKWLDKNSLIRVDLNNGKTEFKIIRLNVQDSKMDLIFKKL